MTLALALDMRFRSVINDAKIMIRLGSLPCCVSLPKALSTRDRPHAYLLSALKCIAALHASRISSRDRTPNLKAIKGVGPDSVGVYANMHPFLFNLGYCLDFT